MGTFVRRALLFLASVPWAGAALANGVNGDHPHMWGGWGWGGMVLGPAMMILFVAGAVAVAILVVRWLSPGIGRASGARTAIDILDERFARGEMDRAEYEERKRVLSD